jgi:hypothetical protein
MNDGSFRKKCLSEREARKPPGRGPAASIVAVSSLLVLALFGLPLSAEEVISVEHDKDKTVYTIGSSGQANQEDQDKAWEMLNNMGIIEDQRKGHAGRHGSEPPAPKKQSH